MTEGMINDICWTILGCFVAACVTVAYVLQCA